MPLDRRILAPGRGGRGASTATCALGIMTKAPRPGSVKTRLTPPLSPHEAARLHRCFLKDTAENIVATAGAHPCEGIAIFTPAGSEPVFEELLPAEFRLIGQRGRGFGERLSAAATDVLAAGYASVCLIDSDSPTLPPDAIVQAVGALARPGDRVVLGPADDGGYYLIGLKADHVELFAGIAWSTDGVLVQTIARAREIGLDAELLPPWYDVDDAAGLRRLCRELLPGNGASGGGGHGYPAPHTRRYLAQLMHGEDARFWRW